MPVLSVSYSSFRNITDGTIDFCAKEIFFVGENGQGKSNLLESIYCLAYGSSFRTRQDSELARNGSSVYSLRSLYRGSNDELDFSGSVQISFDGGKKKIVKNGKTIKDRRDLVTTMPCVVFCHDDLQFVSGEPERRRFFLDQCLSMYDLSYLDSIRGYSRVLRSRNACLKNGRFELLDVYDAQLAQFGAEIQKKRADAVFKFNRVFCPLYEEISGIRGVSIFYAPSWKKDETENISQEDAIRILYEKRSSDSILFTTTSGPHRDKIRFIKNGADFVATASTGQRRLIAVLLRVAQSLFFARATNRKPILLLDDVLLELDPTKRQEVTAHLPDYDQLFCTFLPGEPWENYAHEKTKTYTIKNGEWKWQNQTTIS